MTRLTSLEYLEQLKNIALTKGGLCVLDKYIDSKTNLKFICSEGHEFEARPNNVHQGKWCYVCSKKAAGIKRRNTIDDMKILAKEKGGECISTEYKGMKYHLEWKCSKCNFTWPASPTNIKSGHWCPNCATNRKKLDEHSARLRLEEMKKIAIERGGKCLSLEYKNNHLSLLWQCGVCNHIWPASTSSVKGGSWCPVCSGNLVTIEDMRNLAKDKNGECLSDEFLGTDEKLLWRCSEGHTWWAPSSKIRRHWCRKCYNDTQRFTLEQMQQLAKERGGKCLSNKYQGSNVKLLWECADGHTFPLSPSKIMNANQWCKYCNHFHNQERTRFVFESLLHRKFPINRRILAPYELDGYNQELNLAFEYHGEQHYKYIKFFHKSKDEFKKRQLIDKEKQDLCTEKGINLIIIPYYEAQDNKKKGKSLLNFIVSELHNLEVIPEYDINLFSYKNFFRSISKIKEAQEIARLKGGLCLSSQYVTGDDKLEWQCGACNHIWTASFYQVKHRSWCPNCKGKRISATKLGITITLKN